MIWKVGRLETEVVGGDVSDERRGVAAVDEVQGMGGKEEDDVCGAGVELDRVRLEGEVDDLRRGVLGMGRSGEVEDDQAVVGADGEDVSRVRGPIEVDDRARARARVGRRMPPPRLPSPDHRARQPVQDDELGRKLAGAGEELAGAVEADGRVWLWQALECMR